MWKAFTMKMLKYLLKIETLNTVYISIDLWTNCTGTKRFQVKFHYNIFVEISN